MIQRHVLIPFAGLICCLFAWHCERNSHATGERIYQQNCANCHMDNGQGLGELMPTLVGADYIKNNRNALPCMIRHGLQDTIVVNGKTYAEKMPGMPHLSDIQITNVLNYINNSWGNQYGAYRLDEVRQLLEKCERE